MRITGGEFRGRKINVPAKGTRPATDRVREAVFSSILPLIAEAEVLDLYAGSGSYGFEALSRGAKHCTFIEAHRHAMKTLEGNAQLLKLKSTDYKCITMDALPFCSQNRNGFQPDIIFVDPPFDTLPESFENTLRALEKGAMLREDSIIVFEVDSGIKSLEIPERFEVLRDKKYGTSRLMMMRFI